MDERQIKRLRKLQDKRVMPLIGPLLDSWESFDRSDIATNHPGFYAIMQKITTAMEND